MGVVSDIVFGNIVTEDLYATPFQKYTNRLYVCDCGYSKNECQPEFRSVDVNDSEECIHCGYSAVFKDYPDELPEKWIPKPKVPKIDRSITVYSALTFRKLGVFDSRKDAAIQLNIKVTNIGSFFSRNSAYRSDCIFKNGNNTPLTQEDLEKVYECKSKSSGKYKKALWNYYRLI